MKKNKLIFLSIIITGIITSCGEDFLTRYPSTDVVAGAPATQDVIEQNLTGAYQILLFDCFADGQWMPVNIYFDICSDDLFKGGGNAGDQEADLFMAEYRSTPVNVRTGWWRIFYAGLKRCNCALEAMNNAVDVQPEILARLRAEALTLRAYYVHWLWKAYGNIPYFDKAWTEEPFLAEQHTFENLFPKMIDDLDIAINTSEFPMSVSGASKGRVTKAMAMMTKARIVLYFKYQPKYAEVLKDMETIINDGAYSLIMTAGNNSFNSTNPIEWMFLREGEFCSESIFEVNHFSNSIGKTWDNGWHGFGTYTPRFIGARDLNYPPFVGGWGFCPVQPGAYAIFENGDYRKDASIMEFPDGTYGPAFQNTGFWVKKHIARTGYNDGTNGDRDLNYENNKRIFRLAETYLNAAELAFYAGGEAAAKPYLDAIRERAFGTANPIPATLNNIRLERRREFLGEGMRFWDLIRWGCDETGRPIEQVLTVNDPNYNISRTWDDTKKFLPIPQGEIDKTKGTDFELKQNPGRN